MKKRLLVVLLAMAITFTFPGMSFAAVGGADAQPAKSVKFTSYEANPLYKGVSFESSSLPKLYKASPAEDLRFYDWEDAMAYVREQVKLRNTDLIVFDYYGDDDDLYETLNNILPQGASGVSEEQIALSEACKDRFGEILKDGIFKHTGVSNEGDYMREHDAGIGFGASVYPYEQYAAYGGYNGKKYDFYIMIGMNYLTTLDQENAVDNAIAEVERDLNLDQYSTDYEKAEAIYAYVTDNIVYDEEHVKDETYTLMFTTYAAIVNHCAVCQGYASLVYRLMLDAGLECRVIESDEMCHAWDVVKIDDAYYYLDATWDAANGGPSGHRYYFLKGSSDFDGHQCEDSQYEDILFNLEYPLAKAAYNSTNPEKTILLDDAVTYGMAGDNVVYVLHNNGNVTVMGTGPMYDIGEQHKTSGLESYIKNIQSVTVEEGVTSVGAGFFAGTDNLKTIQLADTVTTIGTDAFDNEGDDYSVTVKASKNNSAAKELATNGKMQFDALDGCIIHDFGEAVELHSDSCEYCTIKVCKDCGSTSLTKHNLVDGADFDNHYEECTVCGDHFNVEKHDYTETQTKAPTCTEKGSKHLECKECGHTEDVDIKELGHDFTGEWKHDETNHWKECTHEGCTEVEGLAAHSFGDWEVTKAATCTAEGEEQRVCECGYTETRTINALEHSFTNYVSNNDATCTEDGTKTAVCDREGCDATDTVADVGSKLGHDFTGEWKHDETSHWKECTHEGCTEVGSLAAHSFGPWVETKAPTCTAKGEETRSCECGYFETREVKELGHSFTNYVSNHDATCTEDGTKTAVCDHDGCKVTDTVTDLDSKLGHSKNPTYVKAKAATVKATGNKAYYICPDCKGLFLDKACTKPTTKAAVTIAKLISKTQKITNKSVASYKASKLKKKAQTFSLNAKAQGKITYKVTVGKSKYITVTKAGKVTLKKGCKKGTYKIKISAAAKTSGKYYYKATSKTISIKVK